MNDLHAQGMQSAQIIPVPCFKGLVKRIICLHIHLIAGITFVIIMGRTDITVYNIPVTQPLIFADHPFRRHVINIIIIIAQSDLCHSLSGRLCPKGTAAAYRPVRERYLIGHGIFQIPASGIVFQRYKGPHDLFDLICRHLHPVRVFHPFPDAARILPYVGSPACIQVVKVNDNIPFPSGGLPRCSHRNRWSGRFRVQ